MVHTRDRGLEDATTGGLRIARQHLLKARERMDRAIPRTGYADWDDALEATETANSLGDYLTSASATTGYAIEAIEEELDRRDEPYET